ncbi:DUF4198 domain-containing protein [Cognatishimia sp. MH4019]|uniref:DUF4198 domain-containing protein n=1 Tax=Cognatishimia sp. MH4019 TaxID=2854030 RepID=UPI001CD7B8CE|nr:DUF4198 domain-containing protein [Cognatishimia sp. MH4019]
MVLRCLTVLCFMLGVQPAFAHEFWISPERYQIATGEDAVAHLRVGQEFKGPAFSYIERQVTRFDLVRGDAVEAVVARTGDNPALDVALQEAGLWIVVHETTDNTLTYREWEKFEAFVAHKALSGVLADHAARGLPEDGFKESYRRFAKALIAVGDGAGQDRPVGLRTEIVALANPYTDDLSDGLSVQVLYEGAPRADAQVELFAKAADDTVTVTLFQTDAEGRVSLPVEPGTEYLVDAVMMIPLEPEAETDPVWKSLWAALTFKTP